MEIVEDIVIVGAGIAGLTTSLGLHRLGIRSLVLESSESLRTTGFALTIWTNGWKVLDAMGVGHSLRQQHCLLPIRGGRHEVRCVRRKALLEVLAKELPNDTIRYSSKVISTEDSGFFKLVHLSDGTIFKTKVLIGCDGVNSVVAKWLGFKKPAFAERFAIRGYVELESGNGLESKDSWFFKNGVRIACEPCDDKAVYWFVNWLPSLEEKLEMERNVPKVLKQLALSKLDDQIPDHVKFAMENTKLDNIAYSGFRYRPLWDILMGTISKGTVCVVGDAFHPTTPYIGQGGSTALEDGLILARSLAQAFVRKIGNERTSKEVDENEEYKRITYALEKYTRDRWWRVIEVIAITNITGSVLLNNGVIIKFLREKVLAKIVLRLTWHLADFDCGKLNEA